MSSVESDVNLALNEIIDSVSGEEVDQKKDDGSTSSSSTIDLSVPVEIAKCDSTLHKDDSSEDEIENIPKQHKKFTKKKTRSASVSESDIESHTKYVRRKFGSEGEVLSLCKTIMPEQQQKELNEAIQKYIDKLLKDSIFKAVKSVNDQYGDEISDVSNKSIQRIESEEEYMMKQHLNSACELVELENMEDRESARNDIGKVGEMGNMEHEIDDASLGGYLADLDDTASVDDLKSVEEDSFNNSLSSGFENMVGMFSNNGEIAKESSCDVSRTSSFENAHDKVNAHDTEAVNLQNESNVDQPKQQDISQLESNVTAQDETNLKSETTNIIDHQTLEQTNNHESEDIHDSQQILSSAENMDKRDQKVTSLERSSETVDLIVMSPEGESLPLQVDSTTEESRVTPLDVDEGLPQSSEDERSKINWKVGNLHVKLPHKTRGKTHLKAWKKRRVVIQPDEFVNDPKNPGLVISVYGSDSKKHETTFWYSVSSLKAVVFRSSSKTHRYAFTISEGSQAIIHLSAENESSTQEWIAAIRAVLWPPSPFMELEKMLSGREFEVSIVDNEFSYHCGLLGMYGYLSITPKKLILIHPQQGYVIQEWYLNTVDKFQFVPQPKHQDEHKVLCMTTCSDSSTGQGEIIFFCSESVTLLQSLASSIHEVLSYHSKQDGGKYQRELEEMAEWLVAPPQDCLNVDAGSDEHYKVPPRQVKSLLDIPNFIFKKSLSPVSSAIYPAPNTEVIEPLDPTRNKPTTTSHDSGISTCTSGDDFLNCSVASFIIGGGPMTGKSSDSELSDAYTPPRTPEMKKKVLHYDVVKEEQKSAVDDGNVESV